MFCHVESMESDTLFDSLIIFDYGQDKYIDVGSKYFAAAGVRSALARGALEASGRAAEGTQPVQAGNQGSGGADRLRFRSDKGGDVMKKLGVALAIAVASVGAARAADLPTTKGPAAAPPVNCFASIWSWLNSTAADCPLSYGPFTVYGTLDGGLGWESHGAGYNAAWNNGVSNIVTKQSGPHSQWLWTPNGLSQSVVGLKMSLPIPSLSSSPFLSGWSLIGTLGTRVQSILWAIWLTLSARKSRTTARRWCCRARTPTRAAPANGTTRKGFIGISNPAYGTLTVGRVNTLSLDAINSYDPMGGSYAFSPIGYSGSYAGFGDTEAPAPTRPSSID